MTNSQSLAAFDILLNSLVCVRYFIVFLHYKKKKVKGGQKIISCRSWRTVGWIWFLEIMNGLNFQLEAIRFHHLEAIKETEMQYMPIFFSPSSVQIQIFYNSDDFKIWAKLTLTVVKLIAERTHRHQSQKNPVSVSAMLTGKFLQNRKVFETSSLLAE